MKTILQSPNPLHWNIVTFPDELTPDSPEDVSLAPEFSLDVGSNRLDSFDTSAERTG